MEGPHIIPWAGKFICGECCRVLGLNEKLSQFVSVPYITGCKCEKCGESRTCFGISADMVENAIIEADQSKTVAQNRS